LYYRYGFDIKFLGLETTTLPDQVRSSVSDIAITAWAKKFDLVTGNVKPGDVIFGLLGDGRAIWEEKKNSGIGSTGLSFGRSSLLDVSYNAKYPALKREGDFYKGRFKLNDCPSILEGMSVSEALLSPTRQWALIIREIIVELKSKNALPMLHSISINTIGGATKIKHVGHGICYVKKMPVPSPIFRLIQQESGATWENMYEKFNCNNAVDIVGEDKPELLDAIKIATHNCGLDYCRLGKVRPALGAAPDNVVTLQTPYGDFNY
jgi:phosphoribosylformylglycinamidine cyclo-ligase